MFSHQPVVLHKSLCELILSVRGIISMTLSDSARYIPSVRMVNCSPLHQSSSELGPTCRAGLTGLQHQKSQLVQSLMNNRQTSQASATNQATIMSLMHEPLASTWPFPQSRHNPPRSHFLVIGTQAPTHFIL